MKNFLFICLLAFGITACGPDLKTYEQSKTTVANTEQSSPLSFLHLKGNWHRNLLGQWVYEGTITSNATLAKYKDPTFELKYYDEHGKKLGTETVTIDEQINPKEDTDVKLKVQGYKGTKRVTATLAKVGVAD